MIQATSETYKPSPNLKDLSTEIEISIVHVNARRKLNCNMQNLIPC